MKSSKQKDSDYFLRRSQEEMAAAERASDSCAQQLHRDLAMKYRDAAAGADEANGSSEDRLGAAPVLPSDLRNLN